MATIIASNIFSRHLQNQTSLSFLCLITELYHYAKVHFNINTILSAPLFPTLTLRNLVLSRK